MVEKRGVVLGWRRGAVSKYFVQHSFPCSWLENGRFTCSTGKHSNSLRFVCCCWFFFFFFLLFSLLRSTTSEEPDIPLLWPGLLCCGWSDCFTLLSLILNLGSFLKYKFCSWTTTKAKRSEEIQWIYSFLMQLLRKTILFFSSDVSRILSYMFIKWHCSNSYRVCMEILCCLNSLEIQREKASFRGIKLWHAK